MFGTTALASMISPFFVGLIADRFFSTERVILVLHLVGAASFSLSRVDQSFQRFTLMLAYCLCYFPTIALTNSLVAPAHERCAAFPTGSGFRNLWLDRHRRDDRPAAVEIPDTFLFAAAVSLAMALFCLALPAYASAKQRQIGERARNPGPRRARDVKKSLVPVFIAASVLACIPLTFYFSFTNDS